MKFPKERLPVRTLLAVLLGAMVALGGCGSSAGDDADVQERVDARAVETRGYVDDLVERLGGTGAKVVGDDITDCVPQDPDSGVVFNYTVRFTVEDDAAARLEGEIADALEADGWTVRRDPPNTDRGTMSTRFLSDSFSMGATIADTGNATAGGSSGCVS